MLDFIQKISRLKLRFEFETPPASPAPEIVFAEAETPKAIAHFEIIGIESVREKYASHWQIIRDHVHQIVRLIIKKHLDEGESFDALPPEQYVVTFLRNGAESTVAAERIRQSIITVFLKDTQLMEHLDIGVRVTEQKPANTQTGPVSAEELAQKRAQKQAQPGQENEKPLYIRASVPDSVIHLKSAHRADHFARNRPPLVRDENGVAILPSPLEFPIRPVWGLGQRAPGCFVATARHVMEDGTALEGYDVLPEDADEDMILELDLRTLRKLRVAMNASLHRNGTPAKILCPVHYKTVADDARAAVYAEAFATLVEDGLGDYVSLQLLHMPRALYGAELEKPIQALWKMTRHTVIMTPLDRSERDGLAQMGVTAVGIDLTPHADAPLPSLQTRMRHYTKIANRERMRTFVIGLERAELVTAAKRAGFTYLSGIALQEGDEASPAEGAARPVTLSAFGQGHA